MSKIKTFGICTLPIIAIIYLSSCNNDKNDTSNVCISGVLKPIDMQILSSEASYDFDNTSGYTIGLGDSTISNLSGNSIFTFDKKSGAMIEKTEIPLEGPGSVGTTSKFDGIIRLGKDKFIYANHYENKIFLKEKNEVNTILTLDKDDNEIITSSYQNLPIIGYEKTYIFPTFSDPTSNLSKEFAFVAIDSTLTSHEKVIPFPAIYDEYFFSSTPYFYWASIIYIASQNNYYVSFPIDKKIYIYDKDFNLTGDIDVSITQIKRIEPFSEKVSQGEYEDWAAGKQYYKFTTHFTGLKSTPDESTLIRFVRKYNENSGGHDYALISYNLKDKSCTYYPVSSSYRLFNSFTSSNGLAILNLEHLINGEESELPFDIFKF